MAKKQKKKKSRAVQPAASRIKDFLDMIAPTAMKFNTDSYVLGGSFRCAMALRSYPATTEELALLCHLGEKSGVALHIYIRQATAGEEDAIIHNAQNKNRMDRGNTSNMRRSINAEANLQDVGTLITTMRRNKEPLVHCAVFIELCARDADGLRALRDEVTATLTRSKLGADRLFLVQRNGFLAVNPAGCNVFASQFERVLPASSVANLFPFNYSGKNDPNGFYIGKDRFGSNIILDLDRRAEDKTNANVLILGNSGQGKSFLLKLLLCNILASGKSVICLDAEHELDDLCRHMSGCFADVMSGEYIINPLEPKLWNAESENDPDAPDAFRQRTRLSQHISFLKDFFRSYKDFTDRHIDTIELMLERLYKTWGLNDHTDFKSMRPEDFPILSDLYEVMEDAYQHYEQEKDPLYPRELLQEVLLGLHSMCKGAESKFFNGHTSVTSHRFLVFGVKDLLNGSLGVRNAMLFNLLSYLSDKLLTEGNTVAGLDELYIWLTNPTAVEYIRNTLFCCVPLEATSHPDNAPNIRGGGETEDEADQEDDGRGPLELAPLAVIEVGAAHLDKEGDGKDHVQGRENDGIHHGLDLPGSGGPSLLDGAGDVAAASGGEGSGAADGAHHCGGQQKSDQFLGFHMRFLLKNQIAREGPSWMDGPFRDCSVSGAGQGLGGLHGLVYRGDPAVGGHDPLFVMNAAHIRLVDELSAALEPGDDIAVDLGSLHLPEVGGHDAEDEHDLRHILAGGQAQGRRRSRHDGVPGGAQVVRDDPVSLPRVFGCFAFSRSRTGTSGCCRPCSHTNGG